MTQNTSHAVMAQRVEAHDSLDDFPTPPWATRALLEHVIPDTGELSAWEPCCNRGYMARPLIEAFGCVYTSDIHHYGWSGQERIADFLFAGSEPEGEVDWIIANPPFRLAEQFYHRGIGVAKKGVALLVRTQFLEGVGRYAGIYRDTPPDEVWQFTERVPMVKGRYDPKASTATSYCWLVWFVPSTGRTLFRWMPPCRRKLERAADWAEVA